MPFLAMKIPSHHIVFACTLDLFLLKRSIQIDPSSLHNITKKNPDDNCNYDNTYRYYHYGKFMNKQQVGIWEIILLKILQKALYTIYALLNSMINHSFSKYKHIILFFFT
jgi:hypothetical protein